MRKLWPRSDNHLRTVSEHRTHGLRAEHGATERRTCCAQNCDIAAQVETAESIAGDPESNTDVVVVRTGPESAFEPLQKGDCTFD